MLKKNLNNWVKKNFAWLLIVGVLLLFLPCGNTIKLYDDPRIKELDSIDKVLKKKEDSLIIELEKLSRARIEIDSLINLNKKIVEENARIKDNEKKELHNVHNLIFNRRELDSIAEHLVF